MKCSPGISAFLKRPLIFPIPAISTVSLQCPFKKPSASRFLWNAGVQLDATVMCVVCVPRLLTAALVLWASAGRRLLYWGSGKAQQSVRQRAGKAWKGARCWPECSKPLSQVLRALPSLSPDGWAHSESRAMRASLLPCGHTHRAVVPQHRRLPGSAREATGASQGWLGLLS